jgi:hypothetical protein
MQTFERGGAASSLQETYQVRTCEDIKNLEIGSTVTILRQAKVQHVNVKVHTS